MYIPYFTFPVNNQRKTGFLYPSISSSSKNGASIATPFYWNIAPNYDMTISPRLMTRRGLQLNTEFRYLTEKSEGMAYVEYLPSDFLVPLK